jgi:hypothetical protein
LLELQYSIPKTQLTTARKKNVTKTLLYTMCHPLLKLRIKREKMAHFGVSYTLTPPIGHKRLTFNIHCIVCVCDLSMQKLKQRERERESICERIKAQT